MNILEHYKIDQAPVAQDEVVSAPVETRAAQAKFVPLTSTEEVVKQGQFEKFFAWLKRLFSWDVEAMYKFDERDVPALNPSKPTSLDGRLVADIWMLNSKH